MITKIKFTIHGKDFFMELKQTNIGFLETGMYRDFFRTHNGQIPSPVITLTETIAFPKEELLADLKTQIDFLNNKCKSQLSANDFVEALSEACRLHISKYNRIIDSDLYAYIDYNILINKCIYDYSDEILKRKHLEMIEEMTKRYKKHMWINHYVGINSIGIFPLG
jgi:hypothetical protein